MNEGHNCPYPPTHEGEIGYYNFGKVACVDEARRSKYGSLTWHALRHDCEAAVAAKGAYVKARHEIPRSPELQHTTVLGWAATLASRLVKDMTVDEAIAAAVYKAREIASMPLDRALAAAQSENLYPAIERSLRIERMLAAANRHMLRDAIYTLRDIKAGLHDRASIFGPERLLKELEECHPELRQQLPYLVADSGVSPAGTYKYFETFDEAAVFLYENLKDKPLRLFKGNQAYVTAHTVPAREGTAPQVVGSFLNDQVRASFHAATANARAPEPAYLELVDLDDDLNEPNEPAPQKAAGPRMR